MAFAGRAAAILRFMTCRRGNGIGSPRNAQRTASLSIITNTIEGLSIFKRGVVGTFHKMRAKYMPLYVTKLQLRYNNRFNPDMFGKAIAGC